jgi:hypothetical protein
MWNGQYRAWPSAAGQTGPRNLGRPIRTGDLVRALSSAGERSLHTGEVVGSIPTAPTTACTNRKLVWSVLLRISAQSEDGVQDTSQDLSPGAYPLRLHGGYTQTYAARSDKPSRLLRLQVTSVGYRQRLNVIGRPGGDASSRSSDGRAAPGTFVVARICWSFSSSMFRWRLVDQLVPATYRNLAAAGCPSGNAPSQIGTASPTQLCETFRTSSPKAPVHKDPFAFNAGRLGLDSWANLADASESSIRTHALTCEQTSETEAKLLFLTDPSPIVATASIGRNKWRSA